LTHVKQGLAHTGGTLYGAAHQHNTEDDSMNAIERAIERAGSRAAFAKTLGVTVQAVCQWVSRGWVPPARALEIEDLYAVPRVELMKPELRAIIQAAAQ
jgi:DNA-binding transcriptional regulator YdaS (Cro superfamily)